MIKVAIIDDQILLRDSVKYMLEQNKNISVVATGKNGKDAIDISNNEDIDIMLLDVSMPDISGIDVAKQLQHISTIKIIILTNQSEEKIVNSALKAGVNGYLLKDVSYDQLISSIIAVNSGVSIFHNEIKDKITSEIRAIKKYLQ